MNIKGKDLILPHSHVCCQCHDKFSCESNDTQCMVLHLTHGEVYASHGNDEFCNECIEISFPKI